ncbi:MAG: tRNA-dihydrouridine synthase family protein [Lachnospiraceae bacterium]|nr:tRNA-dihydrouridine synthase family protein [Lachnospiraceae bacterium]
MKFYFAPMEGVTGYVYRNMHHELFPGIDKYFTPFVVANQTYRFKTKEKKDVAPENNRGLYVVPQIMANKAEEFIWAARELKKLGYEEINLNLGCPAATVVSKKKGSGFLAYPDELDSFLETVFSGLEGQGIRLSIKTRLGKEHEEEIGRLMEIYNRYPLYELIIHARVQKDFYKNQPRMEAFAEAFQVSRHPVCYNGNLFSWEDYEQFTDQFPEIQAVMLGRGLIANPALVRELQGEKSLDKEELYRFHSAVYGAYGKTSLGEVNTLFKMKELWSYMGQLFPDGEHAVRKVRKARNDSEYVQAVQKLFTSCEMNGNYRG